MEKFYTSNDLVRFGVKPLTGEADAYGRRILCDLDAAGAALIRLFLGLPHDSPLQQNWNTYVGTLPAVASVMIDREVFKPLAIFAMLHVADCDMVIEAPSGVTGHKTTDEYYEKYVQLAERSTELRVHRNMRKASAAPNVGGRNTHAMTGRTE